MTLPHHAPTDSPAPAPGATGIDVGKILSSVAHGVWGAVTSSPITAILFALFVLFAVVHVVHAVLYPSGTRDPIRLFTRADKAHIVARAGGRCEHHSLLFGRCAATDALEADHIHPHSRGGWTNLANGQALCRRHNRSKRANIPYNWQLRALEKRRAAYFPPGVATAVCRRRTTPPRRRVPREAGQ